MSLCVEAHVRPVNKQVRYLSDATSYNMDIRLRTFKFS